MPWKVFKDGSQYCVHKLNGDGSKGEKIPGGCHATKSDAENHKRALYKNVEGSTDFNDLTPNEIANRAVRAAIESMQSAMAASEEPLLVDVENVEILKTGIEYQLATGPHTFITQELIDAAEAPKNPNIQVPRIKLGHDGPLNKITSSDEPAVGTVPNLRVSDDGQTLYGDYKDVPAWLADIMASAYPSRSVEGDLNVEKNGHKYSLVITAVSLLGVKWPGCSSIEDIQALYSKEGPEEVQVIEARQGGAMSKAVTASVQTEEIRRAFYEEVAIGDRSYWWICSQYQVPPVLIVESIDGETYSVGYTIGSDDSISFDDPVPVTVQYVDEGGKVAAEDAEPVAVFASRAESRSETDKQEDNGVKLKPEQIKLLRARLGLSEEQLPEDATEEQVTAALAAEADPSAETPPPGDPPGEENPEDNNEEEEEEEEQEEEEDTSTAKKPVAASAKAKTKIPPGMSLIDDETLNMLKAGAQAGLNLSKQAEQNERDKIIAGAIKEGKFPPSRKEYWEKLWKGDPEGTKEIISGLAKGLVPVDPATDQTEETWDAESEAYPGQWLPEVQARVEAGEGNNNGRRRVMVGED